VAGGHTLNIKQGPGPRNRRHPSRIRAGQLFFPRSGDQRLRFTVKAVDGEWARVEREDRSKGRVSVDRLLAADEEGNGIDYRFHGWRRLPSGYRTEFSVLRLEGSGKCVIALPEWDPEVEVELAMSTLPEALRAPGARGSCRADLTSSSEAGLDLHAFSSASAKGLSRAAVGRHPDLLADGQEYRRQRDGKKFRLLEVDPEAATVAAWSERRRVRLDAARLLETGADGEGVHYTYIGGGRSATRRRRAS
jgi:transcription elongation factor